MCCVKAMLNSCINLCHLLCQYVDVLNITQSVKYGETCRRTVSMHEHGVVEQNIGSVWSQLDGDMVMSGCTLIITQCAVDRR